MKIGHFLRHLFVPHESNNHKAKLIRPQGLAFILCLFVGFQLFMQTPTGGKVLGYAANISPDEVIRLTNEKRAANGLAPLTYSPLLSQSAQAKGADMLNKGYWAHVAPDGTEPWIFFLNAGYQYKYAGENLARDFSSASAAVDAWMASPTHRDNLLSPKYKEIGIGVVEGSLNGVDTTIIVQHFGTSLSDSGQVAPLANNTGVAPSVAPSPKPSLSPSPAPVAVAEEATASPLPVLEANGSDNGGGQVLVSPFKLTKGVSLGLVGVLLVVMLIDAVVISRKRIKRVSGRVFAHIAFFGMIAAIILIMRAGQIL